MLERTHFILENLGKLRVVEGQLKQTALQLQEFNFILRDPERGDLLPQPSGIVTVRKIKFREACLLRARQPGMSEQLFITRYRPGVLVARNSASANF